MYLKLSDAFKKSTPLAEVYPPTVQQVESESYFQLLADYGIRLNEPQKQAVKAVEGPVLLVAGAGAGKTTVLTSRIGYMIHTKNIDPSKILLITFTKKASNEMIDRLSRIPGISRTAGRNVVAGTYHSICLKILRSEGYNFSVLSSEKKRQYMIKIILKRMQQQDAYSPEAILNLITYWKNSMVRPQDIEAKTDVERELVSIYKQYEEAKEQENLFDFDDMLLECYYLLKFRPEILSKYQKDLNIYFVMNFKILVMSSI